MEIIDETTIQIYREAIDSIREQLGRFFYIVLPDTTIDCPNCRFDPIKKKSSGIYEPADPYPPNVIGPIPFKGICPVCKGNGRITISPNPIKVKANIRWLRAEDREVYVFGINELADIEIRNIPLKYKDKIIQAKYFLVDNEKCYLIQKPLIEGLRDPYKLTIYCRYERPTNK